LSTFYLPAVKLLDVLAHYANTGKEMLSPFIDSSIDNVMLQTNTGSTSHFLTLQTLLNFFWWTQAATQLNPVIDLLLEAHKLGQIVFIDVFPFILTRIMPGLLSPGSAKSRRWVR